MADKRPALGRGLSALIPRDDERADAARARCRARGAASRSRRRAASRRRRDRHRSASCRIRASRARRSTRRVSKSWRSRSARNGVIQPILVASAPAIASRSSPASAAGAPRSAPACSRCRSSMRDDPRRQAARGRAHREHPARGSESDRRSAGVSPAGRRAAAVAGDHRDGGRQGPRDGRELHAAAAAARRRCATTSRPAR